MLNIYFGEMEEAIYNPAVYFKNTYDPEWFETELARKMVEDIDHSNILSSDITINLRHLMDFGEKEFTIHILNTDQIVHSMEELVMIAGMFVR